MILFFCSGFSTYVWGGETGGYEKVVLGNGATVVSKYVPDSGLVTIQLRVLSGLSNEGEYAGSGISHFLEHLLFKGTHEKSSEEIRKNIKRMGGITNGSTSLDSAEYHITVPEDNFEEALSLLVDMVVSPVFTDEQLETEREVIFKEIRMRNDDPLSRRTRLLFARAFREHIYKYPVIGYEDKVEAVSREDILRYHSKVYTPDKMVLGVVGGVEKERALAVTRKKLAAFKKGSTVERELSPEPKQRARREVEEQADVMLAYISIGFHATSIYSDDLYAGDVLSILLGEGNDSRLYKRLVKEKEFLYTVSSMNYTPKYPGLFMVSGVGDPAKANQAIPEIFSVIGELTQTEIREEELTRAKNIVISGYLYSHERIGTITSSATNSQLLMNDPAFYEKYVDDLQKVTKGDVRKFVVKYLNPSNSTTVVLLPRGFEGVVGGIDVGEDLVSSRERRERNDMSGDSPRARPSASLGTVSFQKTKDSPSSRLRRVGERRNIHDPIRTTISKTLDNGLTIIAKPRPRLPLVSVTLAVLGGLKAENKENNGISNLIAATILKGTNTRSEAEIIPSIEMVGGSIGAFSGFNSIGIGMDMMAKDLDSALDIFEDVAKNASFPFDEMAKQKRKIIAAIEEEETDIFSNGHNIFRKVFYGTHPYSMKILGEIDIINSMTREDVISFYEEHFVPEGTVLTIIGDIDTEKTIENLTERFGSWDGKRAKRVEEEVQLLGGVRQKDVVMKKEQALLFLGFPGVKITDEKKYTLSVISALLSGSDGLLFHVLREKEGLVYTSGAISLPKVDEGYFLIYAATTEENIDKAKNEALRIIRSLAEGNINDEEIESSKNRLLTQHALSMETNSSISMTMTLDELYGLGAENHKMYSENIKAVKRNDIVKCAQETFDTENYAVVIVHSEK